MSYAMRSDFNHLLERVEILEEALGKAALESAANSINLRHKAACAAGDHVWTQVGYDIQGGKWGTDECIHCGAEQHWSVEFGGTVKSHIVSREGDELEA